MAPLCGSILFMEAMIAPRTGAGAQDATSKGGSLRIRAPPAPPSYAKRAEQAKDPPLRLPPIPTPRSAPLWQASVPATTPRQRGMPHEPAAPWVGSTLSWDVAAHKAERSLGAKACGSPSGQARSPRKPNLPVSPVTLSEAFYTKATTPGPAICRGDALEEELQRAAETQLEAALFRRSVVREVGQLHRERAHEHALRKKELECELHQRKRAAEETGASGFIDEVALSEDHVPSPPFREEVTSPQPDPDCRVSFLLLTPQRSRKALRMRRIARAARGRSAAPRSVRESAVVARSVRESKVVAHLRGSCLLVEDEQGRLQGAFSQHADTGNCHGSLCGVGLLNCIRELGLAGRTVAERRSVERLCHEAVMATGSVTYAVFCMNIVPSIRASLGELAGGVLLQQFSQCTEGSAGLIGEARCMEILENQCALLFDFSFAGIRKLAVQAFLELRKAGKDGLDWEGVLALVARIREEQVFVCEKLEREIVEDAGLTSEEVAQHKHELFTLHSSFRMHDQHETHELGYHEIVRSFLECGLIPHKGEKPEMPACVQMTIRRVLREASTNVSGKGSVTFSAFLRLVRDIRKECQDAVRLKLQRRFQRHNQAANGALKHSEASKLFAELGLAPRNAQEQSVMAKLLSHVDGDKSGDLDFQEFQLLVQLITETVRAGRQQQEHKVGTILGFTFQQVGELRESFFDLDGDGNGGLGITECQRTLTVLGSDMTGKDLNDLFCKIDVNGRGRLDFSEFLLFMKILEDPSFDLKAFYEPGSEEHAMVRDDSAFFDLRNV